MENGIIVKTERALCLPTWPWSLCMRLPAGPAGLGQAVVHQLSVLEASSGDTARQVDSQGPPPSF